MKKIDVKKIIKDRNLDLNEVAKQLFPANKYPRLALNRIIAGAAVLDADQISKFALLSGLSIANLYGWQWKSKKIADVMIFTCDTYKAELDTTTWITKIFDTDSMFHESIIHQGSTPISVYLTELSRIINEYKKP